MSEAVGSHRPPRVFISYAHESRAHEELVRDVWILLRSMGVDARLDLPSSERRQDWPLWMMTEVREADYVLVMASSAYRLRAEGRQEADEGRAVQFEAMLIREEFYRDPRAGLGKFVPVLLPGVSLDDVPKFLSPQERVAYRVDEVTAAGIEELLRLLTNQPLEVNPPIDRIYRWWPRRYDFSVDRLSKGIDRSSFRQPVRVFYSYARKDERFRERLETQLRLLQRNNVISGWQDRMIGAGDEWRTAIEDELARADLILLMVSPEFLASDFAYEQEVARALERHERGDARVVPIILRPVGWQTTPIGKLQAVPKDGKPITTWTNRDMAWLDVAERLTTVIADMRGAET